MKLKTVTSKRKSHEVQFCFNEEVASKSAAVKCAARESLPTVDREIATAEEGENVISKRNKLIIRIADRSEYGWDAVEEYQDDELAADSDMKINYLKRKLKTKKKKPYEKPGA